MSVNRKTNSGLQKLAGLYNALTARLSDLLDVNITTPTNGQAMLYNSTTQRWENQDIPSGSEAFIVTITQDEQTGDSVCDKLPSEVAEAYSNGVIIQASMEINGSPAIVPLITFDPLSNTYLFGLSAANQSTYASISGITIGLVKDESNDSWAEITPVLKVVGTPLIATVSKDGDTYSCDKDPFDFEQALVDNCGVILQYIDEHDVKFNYTLIGYKDTYVFATIVPTDATNATIQIFRLDPPTYGNIGWNSITLLEYNLGGGGGDGSTHTYSTEKHAVGTWIDGRTIYEATYEIEVPEKTLPNNHFYYITITTPDADDFAFINIDAMYNIRYDATIVSSGSVVHYNKFQRVQEYPHTDNNCYAYIQSAEAAYNIHQPYARMVFVVNYYPESTSSLTVSNINAKIYATVQFVESAQGG